jgi:two-component system, NarL family, response regulator NreC
MTGSRDRPPGERVRIVLAEDHRVVRRGLQLILDGEADFAVVDQAGDVAAVHETVRRQRPDVLILDLNMPGGDPLDAIPMLRAEAPDTQIVVLTVEASPEFVRAARRAGALGYVVKESADTDLVEAVRRAAAGQAYINRQLASRLVADRTRQESPD